VLEIAQAEAAELFLHRDAVQAELAHLGPQLAREFVGAVDLLGQRRNAVGREAGGGLADRVGGLAEAEIQSGGGSVRDHAEGLACPHSRRNRINLPDRQAA
jgi:hypothetical protein